MFTIIIGVLTLVCILISPADGRLFDGLLVDASDKGLDFLAAHVTENGHYNASDSEEDLWFYYKLPMILFVGGRLREANLVLDHIKTSFMQPDGDFKTSADLKSIIPEAARLYVYCNVFIVMAAQRMERYDVVAPGLEYLEQYFKNFPTRGPPIEGHTTTDAMTVAHIGTLALFVGDKKTAKRAAKLIKKFVRLQPDLDNVFYYKMDGRSLVTELDETRNVIYFVNKTSPNAFVTQVAYPAAFLASYYRSTGKEFYLKMAKNLLYWVDTCHESIYAMSLSTQKVAVASSLVGAITHDTDIIAMAERASLFLLGMQNEDGTFFNTTTRRPSTSEEVPLTLRLIDSML